MSTHAITVTLPGGGNAETVVVDESTYRLLEYLVQKERVRKAQEAARAAQAAANAWAKNFTFTFNSTSGLFEDLFRQTAASGTYTRPGEQTRTWQSERPATPRTATEALAAVKHYAGDLGHGDDALRKAVRRAKRKAHPDTGGTNADFQIVTAAEQVLRSAGRIR